MHFELRQDAHAVLAAIHRGLRDGRRRYDLTCTMLGCVPLCDWMDGCDAEHRLIKCIAQLTSVNESLKVKSGNILYNKHLYACDVVCVKRNQEKQTDE